MSKCLHPNEHPQTVTTLLSPWSLSGLVFVILRRIVGSVQPLVMGHENCSPHAAQRRPASSSHHVVSSHRPFSRLGSTGCGSDTETSRSEDRPGGILTGRWRAPYGWFLRFLRRIMAGLKDTRTIKSYFLSKTCQSHIYIIIYDACPKKSKDEFLPPYGKGSPLSGAGKTSFEMVVDSQGIYVEYCGARILCNTHLYIYICNTNSIPKKTIPTI